MSDGVETELRDAAHSGEVGGEVGDMHIHKPKAAHGLREFLGEISVIVVGILIALTAEQVAEQWHWSERVHEVHGQLLSETSANASSALVWLAVSPCLDHQLAAADQEAWEARRLGVLQPAAQRFSSPLVVFTSDSWLNARSLQVSDHLKSEEVTDFTGVYFFPAEMKDDVTSLHEMAAGLEPLTRPLEHVTPAEADEFITKIGRAKELQSRMELGALLLIRMADRVHAPSPLAYAQSQLAEYRSIYGACVSDPAEVLTLARAHYLHFPDAFRRMRLATPDLPG